jgi:hypothetical protein
MKKLILSVFFALLACLNVFAFQTFTLVSSEKKSVKQADLIKMEKSQSVGRKENSDLIFTDKEIRLIVTTGGEDDSLSYRIQGVRNANLILPSGAMLKILFVNSTPDMRHDIRFGRIEGEFALSQDIGETVGSQKLMTDGGKKVFQAEELVIKAGADGAFKYFCSVGGHAKGGMWGNIFVGIKPDVNVKSSEMQKMLHKQ